METFTALKELVDNPDYQIQRQKQLQHLSDNMIDPPIVETIRGLNGLTCCFTLQCCYGHFVYPGRDDPHNLEPLPVSGQISAVKYRIAYIALCLENSRSGRAFLTALSAIPAISPENIQFCCAEWFWERQVNSYALQVEPDRFKHQDTAILELTEAYQIEKIRNAFFNQLNHLLKKQRW